MGCWTHHNMWLLLIVGLQFGLLSALAPDSTCNPSTEFSCRNDSSICISLSRVKDGTPDCPDKSDEECNEEEFQCQSIHQCIPKERFHDGWPDCDDGSDEECGRGQFRCRCGAPHCIEGSKVKDGVKDCEDGSDEVSAKSRNKTARCPDESRLQDLLAVEKRRRRRQIHAFQASLSFEDNRKYDETILNLQPSLTDSYSNNFQYSYTKFLNERLSRDEYNPQENSDIDEEEVSNAETSSLENVRKTLSTKPFMVRTETDLYGSLNSGKIYQTAVNEPISVQPSAEPTILVFDSDSIDKKSFLKSRKEKSKKPDEQESRRLSDLMLKIAALFQNDSDVDSSKSDSRENRYLKFKADKSIKNRKLLSVSNDEHELSGKLVYKRSLQDPETEVSHEPLIHSPTIPYLPESNVHTTGVVMSTKGTDIIDGKTTEWTTIIEGTFISGTYAHIVHSTSRIYYTVDIPKITTEATNSVNIVTPSNADTNFYTTTTETLAKNQNSYRPQRRNDKSFRLLDDFDVTSSTNTVVDFQILPTTDYSTLLDITSVNDDMKSESHVSKTTSFVENFKETFPTEDKYFTSFRIVEENPTLEKKENTTEIETSNLSISTDPSIADTSSDILSIDEIKDIDLGKEKSIESNNEPGVLNNIGRMAGDQNSEAILDLTISTFENSTSDFFSTETHISKEDTIATPTSVIKTDDSTRTIEPPRVGNDGNVSPIVEFSLESSNRNFLPLSKIPHDDVAIVPLISSPDREQFYPMETSLGIPDVSDLFAAFMPASVEKSDEEITTNTLTELNIALSDNISPTPTSSMTNTEENSKEVLKNAANFLILNETTKSTFLSEYSSSLETDADFTHEVKSVTNFFNGISLPNSLNTSLPNASEVMVFLGVASTLNNEEMSTTSITPSNIFITETEDKLSNVEDKKSLDSISILEINEKVDDSIALTSELNNADNSRKYLNDASDITVLLLPSMNLDDLKSLMASSLSSRVHFSEREITDEEDIKIQSMTVTPALDDSILSDNINVDNTESEKLDKLMTSTVSLLNNSEKSGGRVKRAVSESVTILRPEGRIVSTDARVYLTPTTLYTTYTYFTTILIPGGGTQIRSSLHVDSVVVEPTDRAVYGYGGHEEPCHECRIHPTVVHDEYRTRYQNRPLTDPDAYHVETVPYDADRASEITHRTTYTYYTTRFRGGTSFVETRKETVTDVTPIPSVRYSPFEIGTYYSGDITDDYHYHTEAPHIDVPGPRPIVTQPFRNNYPAHSQRIDPNLYKPDRVTHRTTYTYHTTRFRDGVPIVNTRKETETNVTPIPVYNRHRQTVNRVAPSRAVAYNPVLTQTYRPHTLQGSDPYATHRTTYTYFTTKLIGGSTHVDTRYVTETNISPKPTLPYLRGTVYDNPHYDDGHYENECPVCRETQRVAVARHTPQTRVHGRNTARPNRRSEIVGTEIQPSTATLFSTYTYATTQLTRGGRPVVRTREHTVTEILSDVVLPTLKFGDRIRHKRTVKPEDVVPKSTIPVDTIHVVPIRHTFSRTNSYADGRQDRRIRVNDRNVDRSQRVNTHVRTPVLNKVDVRNRKENGNSYLDRSQNSNKDNNFEIQPTSITYFSTYTYFTTELEDGKPVVKSREHTVTEILTDVIVPTVSNVRKPLATRVYDESLHHRRARDLAILFLENAIPSRRLLTVSEDADNASKINDSKSLQPSMLTELNSVRNIVKSEILSSSKLDFFNSITPTPSLEFINSKLSRRIESDTSLRNNAFTFIENNEDLVPAGAEVRRATIAAPVTHYTTYTYYTTKLQPGGSRIIETNTKVASSVIYPDSTQEYGPVEYTRTPYNKRKLYASHVSIQSSPVSHAGRRAYQTDTIYGLGSAAVHRSSNPYRRQPLLDNKRICPNCSNRNRGEPNPYEISGSYGRSTSNQQRNYLINAPVRHANYARRIPDRGPNDVSYPDSNIKPTHVTYYSTYTYYTTEPLEDGSSTVKTREHTVTEILTDVIVPTVASLNRVQGTVYNSNNYRGKRETSRKYGAVYNEEYQIVNPVRKRSLLSLENENFTTDSFLSEKLESDNSDFLESYSQNPNFTENTDRNSTLNPLDQKGRNFTLLEEKVSFTHNNISEANQFQGSEIFNNDTSRFSEINNLSSRNESEVFLETNITESNKTISRNITKIVDDTPDTYLKELLISVSESSEEKNNSGLNTLDESVFLENPGDEKLENVDEVKILPTPSITFPYLKTENNIPAIETADSSDIIDVTSDYLRSSFLYRTNFLKAADASFYPSLPTELLSSLMTPNIGKSDFTGSDIVLRSEFIPNSEIEELLFTDDLTAEGAEVRHTIVATPTTHFTTYTYYSIVLKPNGKSEVITNSKVIASTYYPNLSNSQGNFHNNHRSEHQPLRNHVNKLSARRNYPQAPKSYDLKPEQAIARPQYAYQPSRTYQTYKPSFATRVRGPQYETVTDSNKCLSCNRGNSFKNDYHRHNAHTHNRNGGRNYLTSIPVRRLSTQHRRISNTVPYEAPSIKPSYTVTNIQMRRVTPQHRRISNPNTIPYEVSEVKPTRVTYYSTYTYFTTELQNESPVVRSREHTVTEILTDVIVPTVTSFSRTKATRYPNLRGKRYALGDNIFEGMSGNLPFQRKLLSVDEDENIDVKTPTPDVDDVLKVSLSSHIFNSNINEDVSLQHNLVASLNLQDISPSVQNSSPSSTEMNDTFLSNAQFSKAFAAYLAFLDTSGAKSENLTSIDAHNSNTEKMRTDDKSIKPAKSFAEVESNISVSPSKSKTKSMMSVLTSNVVKNGRMTKYTTTIYGTYINGVYAQRAKSTSDVILVTEIDTSLPVTTLMFSPSRLPGLVRSMVSRKVRGPVAVHLTTEIHGTFVGGAYAQTARVFTSSQPLSSTRELSRHRIPSYATISPTGSRKTGLLSTKVLRSKVDGSTTLLFVSEIYGTHIGGAYAHLGTYTTRKIIQTPTSTFVEPETISSSLPTYYMEDLTTGLVTESVSEKDLNGITTRYHYQVFGTYLDGTYAHVPSISTETLTPRSAGTLSTISFSSPITSSLETISVSEITETIKTTKSIFPVISKSADILTPKIGLIHASTRAHVTNGTTTQHIFEVHGTYLNGNYAHVPSVSVITIEPSMTLEKTDESQSPGEIVSSTINLIIEDDFEILTIFSDTNRDDGISVTQTSESTIPFPLRLDTLDIETGEENSDKEHNLLKSSVVSGDKEYSSILESDLASSINVVSDKNQVSSNVFPILLPEALRLSFSHEYSNPRVKRNDPFSPYLRSSFTDSIKSPKETQHSSLKITTPLPASVFGELSVEFLTNASKLYYSSKIFKKPLQTKLKHSDNGILKGKSTSSKSNMSSKTKQFYLKRSKRSPAAIRSTYGNNRRFGASSSNSRKFISSNTFKRDTSSSSTRGFRQNSSSNKNTIAPTKASISPSKSIPNFLTRSQRSKPNLLSKTSSSPIKPSPSSSKYTLPSIRSRRFGKNKFEKESEKMEEDFEASEDSPQSVTQEKIKPTAPSTSRFRRPSKLSKFNARPSSSISSRFNKIITPTSSRRARIQTKNLPSRIHKNNFRDFDEDIQPTEVVETTSTKRRFTLTTTFEINLKSSAGYLSALDTDEGNNLQDDNANNKRRNKNRISSNRSRQSSSYKPVFDNDDNEVRSDKTKSLPLPVFGRSRGLKRPPKFDPRTIKAAATSTIIYITPTSLTTNDTNDVVSETKILGPITVTDVFTTVKTLPVHLGLRTSFATITTTAHSTSTIQQEDLTYITLGGITKTLLSAITGFPDANLPVDKQFTVVTEILVTTTEIESTSLVAIKVGYGTRTDTVIVKQKLTTLSTQTNTIIEEKTASIPFQQQYPFYPNPFAPPIPPQHTDFSLSLSENSFVSTQKVTSTTILPLFFNGKTVLTTLTSTYLSEETLVKTTTFKVPQQPSMQPFIFPQPVFILPSITTELTIRFTAHNGEIYSIVTQITVPLSLNGHTRFARSVPESLINPTSVPSYISPVSSAKNVGETVFPSVNTYKDGESTLDTILQGSFSTNIKGPLSSEHTEILISTLNANEQNAKSFFSDLQKTKSIKNDNTETKSLNFDDMKYISSNENKIEYKSFNVRKLLQFDDDEEVKILNDEEANEFVRMEDPFNFPGTQGGNPRLLEEFTYVPDTFHLIGPGFDEEGLGRPIPSVRVVPTRRAYVRRLKPSGSQNLPYEGNNEEFNFRRNNQNFPSNINAPPDADFRPVRPGLFQDENIGLRRNVPIGNRPIIPQDRPVNNFGTLRNTQYFAPNRPSQPTEFEDGFTPARLQPNFGSNRPNRLQEVPTNLGRNPATLPSIRSNRPTLAEGYDALRNLPNYTPTRQNSPQAPPREEPIPDSNQFGEDKIRNQINRPQPAVTASPRRVIRLRRPGGTQNRPQSGRELLDRKPIINTLPEEKESAVRARGPVIIPNNAIVRDTNNRGENDDESNPEDYTEPLPLTYYTTFTYMTTFLNGPSTAYSTREAVVSNIATETVNPRLIGLIRSKGGVNPSNGAQTAVPLGSRAQGATTTIVNLASRVQLYNSDVYYGRYSRRPEEEDISPTEVNLRTVPITDIASLPKTYYTLFTYFYTLKDGDKSTNSLRSETISNIDTQTEPFIRQDFASTIDSSGFLTLKPNKQLVNLGLRTAGGTTTEVNLELKTVVHFDGLKNAVIDRGSITATLVEVVPSETNLLLNNYLDPDDAEVQDQQTYPQTVPIRPSFSSANEAYEGTQRSASNREATPEIPSNSRVIRTQSIRGPLRIASTVRPGSLRSGVFAPRPGVRVRVRPVSSRVVPVDSSSLISPEPDLSSYKISFDPSRTVSDDESEFDEEDADVTTEEDDSTEDYTTEGTTEEEENKRASLPGRKRLKITIRRSPGVSVSRTNSAFIRPSRTRPRFYVVTRTASPTGQTGRQPKRPVSVKVSRRLRPSGEPEYETFTTMTSVPVVFGLSTAYRNTLVTSSSLISSDVIPEVEPSKTVILTYFTTTTYTVPYTVDGIATFTTLEETNSRIATETLGPDDDLSFISTSTLDAIDEISASSADLVKQPPQTLRPQLVNNQLNVGPRINLATKVSNGVTLIVASDGEAEATDIGSQPTLTLRPTVVTDALYMTNKDITTVYEPRTFYTTFTFFTTFFSGGTPSISTSEQVITNVYSIPVTQSITSTQPINQPVTVIETSENLVRNTVYTTHTFYATLFNGTGTIVTPIEELHSSVETSTETYTITKTLMPQLDITPTKSVPVSTTTSSIYRTRTNYVTLFRGTESIVSPLEEIETDIVTLTLENPKESYTTRTIQATNTHYITLFSGSESILSSITEVAPSVITEIVKQLQGPSTTPFAELMSIQPTTVISSSSSTVEPVFQDLVPSVRTQYTTLTYFTTLFTDSSPVLSSREEVATSYITLFVPAPIPGATKTDKYTSQTDQVTQKPSRSNEIKDALTTPTSEILTFYTTYTYYTTLFKGNEAIISDSETVVTQYVTIESTPTDSVSRNTASIPTTFSRPSYSDSFEIRTEPSTTSVTSPSFDKDPTYDKKPSDEELKIIGVSTKVESDNETPSILTGIPSTDANGATHILFTDFIVPSSIKDSPAFSTNLYSEYVTPSLPDLASSVVTEPSSVSFEETTYFPHESSTLSSAREKPDLATTRYTGNNVATHHMVLQPTTTYQSGTSQTMGIKPGAVIDLSDVLTNTNLVGNLGETIKDIVNLFAANGNRAGKNSTSKSSQSSSDTSVVLPSGGITISSAEDPVFIPIGAIARSTKISSSRVEGNTGIPLMKPSTMLSGFTPIRTDDDKFTLDANNRKIDSISSFDLFSDSTLTSIVFGSNTIFIQPTGVASGIPATMLFSDMDGRFHNSFDTNVLYGSEKNHESSQQEATPGIKYTESTSIITGLETIFFGFPDARQPPQATTQLIQGSGSTSSIVGYETIFFDSPKDFFVPGSNRVNITGDTTIFGTYPIINGASQSTKETPKSTFTSTSSGETTIFFPVPGENQQQSPGTRYVTSVESVTLTLTLTTSSVYQTEGTPVTVTSVFTTTIPPRTFVSTIIGDRTILGTQPEPTEALQVIPTIQPSESTTTVTTTTLIFNSIATTVVRTLVIPTNAIHPTKPTTTEATDVVKLGGIAVQPNERPRVTTQSTTPRKPIQLFKSGNRPTDPTTAKPPRSGPPLKLFPTKPPTTTTLKPPARPVTTRKGTFRKPGKTLVPITDGCLRECNLKNKEVCKQNLDKTWSCQCRPGFFKKNGSEECKDVKSFTVLVRVLKMGDNDVTYSADLSNHLSPEYKNLTTTARKAVDDAYKSSVGDDFVSTNVLSVARDTSFRQEGVLVNLTVQLSGEKPSNEDLLKEELTHSLEAASSDVSIANASVSPIIQRVEDVQDFDECYDDSYNDCSKSSTCINLPGTYTCECKEGYQDLEPTLPGRICSGEIKDCDYCNNRGVCIMTENDEKFCRCYRMYLGKQCEINGLVLAIALPIALALLILTMFCLLCGCRKLRQRRAQKPKPNVFKGMVPPLAGTLDRKAMIMDSSSESSGEHRPPPTHAYDGFADEVANSTMKRSRRSDSMDDHMSEFQVPTVLIPRAKHSHPKQMIFGRDGENIVGKDICTSYTALPGRRMSTQSLICEAPSLYPSVPRRQGSLCPLDKLAYDTCVSQLNELRDARLPPPACHLSRRRRSSVASSQAALAGSGLAYMGSNGSRCHSALGHYGLEPELWLARRMSMTQSELLNEVNLSPSSTNPRQRWSEAGRSFGETTIRASLRQFRTNSDFLVPGSRQASSRQITSEEQSVMEDLMDMSFTDSLMEPNVSNYERLPRKDKKRRNSRAYNCYDDPSSLQQYNGT